MSAPYLHQGDGGVLVDLMVQPRASRNELVGVQGEALKVRLTSPPVEGAANRLCGEFFAKLFGVAKGEVVLVGGERSRHKRLLIRGGSAGGYTTVCALTWHDEFAAGASYFGLVDLEPFADSTHKFELRYTDNLVGPWPEAIDLWRARSPIRCHRVRARLNL